MKVTQGEVEDRQTVLQIELEDGDLDQYLDRGYSKVAPHTVVPGFRKGKAPRRIAERFLGREVLLNEVLDSMVSEVADLAITEQDLDAAGMPHLELQGLDPFTLKATVPLRPEVDLGPYRDIRIASEEVKVTEEDVQQRLEQFQASMATWEPVDRPVQMGDTVTISAAGTVEGRTLLDDEDTELFLDEDSNRPFPGFAQNLTGLVRDESKEFTLSIPEDYPDRDAAGKDIQFSVAVNEIKERILPELDEEFAKSFGDGYESLEALRQEVEQDLKNEAEEGAAQEHRESALKALVQGVTIELPPVLLDHEINHTEAERERLLSRMNVRLDDYLQSVGKTEEEMRSEMREAAVERLNRSFAISKLAELEGLEVSDEEVDQKVQSLMPESGEKSDGRQVTDEMRSGVQRMLLVEKSLDRLATIALGEAPELAEPDQKPADDNNDAEEGDGEDDAKT